MRAFLIELLDEVVELDLLLKEVLAGGSSGLLLESQRHALMTAVLLRMAGTNAFDADAEAQPPHGELGEVEQTVGRSQGNTMIGADGPRQTPFFEKTLEGHKSRVFAIGLQGLPQQPIARGMIGNGEGITVALVG